MVRNRFGRFWTEYPLFAYTGTGPLEDPRGVQDGPEVPKGSRMGSRMGSWKGSQKGPNLEQTWNICIRLDGDPWIWDGSKMGHPGNHPNGQNGQIWISGVPICPNWSRMVQNPRNLPLWSMKRGLKRPKMAQNGAILGVWLAPCSGALPEGPCIP